MSNIHCPCCNATIKGETGRCWKCGTWLVFPDNDPAAVNPVLAELADNNKNSSNWLFTSSTLLLIASVTFICLSVGFFAPGLAVTLAFLAVVPVVRTFIVVAKKKSLGQHVSSPKKASLFLGSVAYMIAAYSIVAFVLAICGFVLLIIACFGMLDGLSPSGGGGSNSVEPVFWSAIVFAVLILVGLLIALGSWARRRWYRDVYGDG